VTPAATAHALRAAIAVAARHGVRCDEPVILRNASNLLVRLDPAPVVARVMTVTRMVRADDATLDREVAVASHLAALGAPVVPPSAEIPPGPHHHDGEALTFWTYVDEGDRPLDATEAGRRLRACHDALASFAGELPYMGAMSEAHELLAALAATGAVAADDAGRLQAAGDAAAARIDELALPPQAIHGDAHLHNVINGPDGPLWNDWEDTFLGPRAWDLACLHAMARLFGRDPAPVGAAQDGYGEPLHDDVLDAFLQARRFQGTVWSVAMARVQPEYRERRDFMLAGYREQG
jgi:aminoglycoside phosphotransferase (APT) family kinase protein